VEGTGNLASQAFWERNWAIKKRPGQYNPRNYSHRRFDAFFRRHLQGAAGRTMLEVGCAQSSWLPYFHLAYGCRVTGMDYSPTGCRMSRQLLDEAGVPGEVLERDLFADNGDLEGTFDFLFSLGFIEHFEDTVGTLARMRRFLKPGGTILTIVPNFPGWLGVLQKMVHPEVYGMHILLDLPDLERVHRDAGFTTVEAGYLGTIASRWSSIPIPPLAAADPPEDPEEDHEGVLAPLPGDRPPPGIRARLPVHRVRGNIDRHNLKASAVAAGLLRGCEPLVEPLRPFAHRRRRVAGEDELPVPIVP